jgi:hypothetical protein
LPAIPFHLPRVALTVFIPIPWVRFAPLPRTIQADLLIHRIGSDLLPMIIGAALALACRLIANLLLRMITVRLKRLPTVAATVKLHQAAPAENGEDSFSLEALLNLKQPAKEFSAYSPVAAFPLIWLLSFRCFSLPASMESEFQRRVAGPTKTHDYAV